MLLYLAVRIAALAFLLYVVRVDVKRFGLINDCVVDVN